MKIILTTLLLIVTFTIFSQTEPDIYIEEDLLGYKDQGIESLKEQGDKNREKALEVVSPMDEAISRVMEIKNLNGNSEPGTFNSIIANANRKVKMVEYSDLSFEDSHTKNEDGTWSPKEKFINKEENELIAKKPYKYKEIESIGIFSKIFTIIMFIILWFVAGFVINFIIYHNRPEHEMGTSSVARYLHILTNIALAIMILASISR